MIWDMLQECLVVLMVNVLLGYWVLGIDLFNEKIECCEVWNK